MSVNVYDLHPGLKEIEKEHGLSLKYVKLIPGSYASIVSLLKDESTYYVAKTAVKHYEEITYYRDAYGREILKDTSTIIGTLWKHLADEIFTSRRSYYSTPST